MNFVAQVEDHLRDLGAEARRHHPGVTEASDRAIIHLRSLQTQYVAAVRRAGAASSTTTTNSNGKQQQQPPSSGSSLPLHPTTALFQSQDVLRPFLFAANYPDASYELLVIALESIQHLLRGDAVCPEDGIQISRALVIQSWGCAATLGLVGNMRGGDLPHAGVTGGMGMAAGMIHAASSSVSGALGGITGMVLGGHFGNNGGHNQSNRTAREDQSIALKILRTTTMLADSRSVTFTRDVLGECLLVCLLLGAGRGNGEHGGGTAVGTTMKERFIYSATAASNREQLSATTKDGSSGLTGATAGGDVKRAAIAALNKLLLILFDRAKDALTISSSETKTSKSSILLVAERTMADLCLLSSQVPTPRTQSQCYSTGPFAAAEKDGLLPSPTTSLALVDMIMKQISGDLFRLCFDFFGSSDAQRRTTEGIEFAARFISLAFQLGRSLLESQYSYFVTKLSLESSLQDASKPSPPSNLIDFCSYYYTTSLVKTLLSHYLSSTSKLFYTNFDARVSQTELGCALTGEQGDNGQKGVPTVSELALDLIRQLVQFCNGASEAYHKSDDFEDGYIFTQTERESFDFGKSNHSNNRALSSRSAAQGGGPSVQQQPMLFISNEILWRAFLALEALGALVTSYLEQVSWLDFAKDSTNNSDCGKLTVSLIAKAASDFATSSASNRERILYLLMAAHAEDDSENSNAAAAAAEKVTAALVIDSIEIPRCDTGATTWLAFKCIIFLVKSMQNLAISVKVDEDTESRQNLSALLDGSFAPTVSMLQHFIRRMLGSPVIVSKTLLSYKELACASMLVDGQSTKARRQAILTSLCKLCLPSWGKKRHNCQLRESNIDALLTMLWIIHSNFDKIHDEWDIIVGTLDQLAILQIASSSLHQTYIEKATTIAGSLSRLPLFTTCFSRDALQQFVTSLVKLSDVVSFDSLEEQSNDNTTRNSESEITDSVHVVKEPSISGKLISFAGRAFGGGGGTAQSTQSNNNASIRRSSTTSQFSKTYAEDLRETACFQMAEMKLSTPRSIIRKIPLPLLLVVVVAEANSYRLSAIDLTVAKHLCEIVARSSSSELQSYALEVLIHFMPLSLSKSEVFAKYGLEPLMIPGKERPLEVLPIKEITDSSVGPKPKKVDSKQSAPQLLTILCQTIQRSIQVDTAENCLNALLVVLEGAVNNLSGKNLITLMDTLSIMSGCNSHDQDIDRSTKRWSNVSSLAFQNLKLILDDFLEMSSPENSLLKSKEERVSILDCCVAFGRSRHDVNTSLTAIGMLWSLADRDASPGTLDVVLSKLSWLAMDDRPELRNCSVNTLFSCVVGLGGQFTDQQWKDCLVHIIFGQIMSGIASAIEGSESETANSNGVASEERYKVAVHHSRDSARKQWINTQALVLRGLERVLRLFYSRLLFTVTSDSNDLWFLQSWNEILRLSFDSALSGEGETLDVRLAGIELLALCAQLSCQAGIGAAGTSARVGTNMEVVGGALRRVRAAVELKATVEKFSVLNHPEVESSRQKLFDVSFDKLDDLRVHLEQNRDVHNAGTKGFMPSHSSQTQTLTKLIGELTKLYECCKSNEMLPGLCELQLDISIEDNGCYESRFLRLLLVIVENSGNDNNSRYLNQVQRGVMSLLQGMASNSSLRAFKALTTISGDYLFVRSKALLSKPNSGYDDNEYVEMIELEAAKTVASAFDSDDLSNEAKVVVMCSVMLQYLKTYGTPEDLSSKSGGKRASSDVRYDLLTSVLDSGVEAAAHIDSTADEKKILDFVWGRIIATVQSLLLPPSDNPYDGYAHHSKSIVNIVAIVLTHLPQRKMSLAEPVLENGAKRAVDAAFSCTVINQDDKDAPYSRASEGAIHVFLACFMGLTQVSPTSPAVSSLTSRILGETIESVDGLSKNTQPKSRTRQSLAIAVCESLRTTTSQDLLVGAFPFLCRLTNVEDDGLRRAAGKILGQINLSEVISRERERAEQAISRERQKAEQADARAREIEEENVAMLEEIEYLQAENEELQRQKVRISQTARYLNNLRRGCDCLVQVLDRIRRTQQIVAITKGSFSSYISLPCNSPHNSMLGGDTCNSQHQETTFLILEVKAKDVAWREGAVVGELDINERELKSACIAYYCSNERIFFGASFFAGVKKKYCK